MRCSAVAQRYALPVLYSTGTTGNSTTTVHFVIAVRGARLCERRAQSTCIYGPFRTRRPEHHTTTQLPRSAYPTRGADAPYSAIDAPRGEASSHPRRPRGGVRAAAGTQRRAATGLAADVVGAICHGPAGADRAENRRARARAVTRGGVRVAALAHDVIVKDRRHVVETWHSGLITRVPLRLERRAVRAHLGY